MKKLKEYECLTRSGGKSLGTITIWENNTIAMRDCTGVGTNSPANNLTNAKSWFKYRHSAHKKSMVFRQLKAPF